MTARTAKSTQPMAKKSRRLSLSRQTLKDLTSRGSGPKGGNSGLKQTYGSCGRCSF